MLKRTSTIVTYSLTTVAMVVLLLGFGWSSLAGEINKLVELRNEGGSINATILSTQCESHGKVTYRFLIGDQSFINSSNQCGQSCSKIRIGDSIQVKYLIGKPAENECGFIDLKIDEQVRTAYFIIAFCFLIITIGFASCLKRLKTIYPESDCKEQKVA